MISYNLTKMDHSSLYLSAKGWKVANTIDVERIANCVKTYSWSPIVFLHGERKSENFTCARILGLDFETPNMTIEKAIETFANFRHVIGTTTNHQLLKDGKIIDRLRVLLFYEDIIDDVFIYQFNYKLALAQVPADKQCKDLARTFLPCKEIISTNANGSFLAIEKPPKETIKKNEYWAEYYKAGVPHIKLAELTRSPAPKGLRNITAYKVARELCKYGIPIDQAIEKIRFFVYGNVVGEGDLKGIECTVESAYKKGRV